MAASKGITCPHCGSRKLPTVTVRRPVAGLVVRYRKCRECKRTIVTEERPKREYVTTP